MEQNTYNDMFMKDVNMNITNERLYLLQESLILASVHTKDVKYVYRVTSLGNF
jgi:hypothetical protein